MTTGTVDHDVVIVGAGFSGIGMAISLDRAGLSDYLIVEDGEGFGGTWYWNRYPGVAVDIPSFSYQFSFAKRPTWTRVYAPGQELRAYAEYCADRFGLNGRTRFGTRITAAIFDESLHAWRLETRDGDTLTARHVIDATGVLTQPKRPDIDGVDEFAGITMHTARWDHEQELAGKRIAVIGTGASAVQVIPAVAPQAQHLTVFQRTPIWCLPKLDGPLSPRARWFLSRVPGGMVAARLASQTLVELTFPIAAHYHGTIPLARIFESQARAYVRKEVHDPELQEKLIPQYSLGCKRPGFHNEYLATYNRENVSLETDSIERITAGGVVTKTGTEHEVDVLVLATGFKVFDPGNFPKYPVTGRDGIGLEQWWAENRYQAYEGVSVPGFPNYFAMFGPYGYNGSSYFNLIETQARHIVRCLRHADRLGATMVEVTPGANARYFNEMLSRRGRQVFWQGSCSLANSYYFDPHGDVPLRPSPTIETMWRARRFPLTDYRFEVASGPSRAAAAQQHPWGQAAPSGRREAAPAS
jgi:cation diffusion facilitator CzcD-associated flavoprotein CzcO